ncbi:hypothetical protein SK128_020477, partial [Halocaridina rubra]
MQAQPPPSTAQPSSNEVQSQPQQSAQPEPPAPASALGAGSDYGENGGPPTPVVFAGGEAPLYSTAPPATEPPHHPALYSPPASLSQESLYSSAASLAQPPPPPHPQVYPHYYPLPEYPALRPPEYRAYQPYPRPDDPTRPV